MIQSVTRANRSPKNQDTMEVKKQRQRKISLPAKYYTPPSTAITTGTPKSPGTKEANQRAGPKRKISCAAKYYSGEGPIPEAPKPPPPVTRRNNSILRRHSFNVLSPDPGKKKSRHEVQAWPLMTFSFPPAEQDRERQDQLQELLARYSTAGLPPLPELLALGTRKFNDQLLEMEVNWRDFVSGHENMTKRQQERQEAVWELLNTEVSYIKQISVIIDVFRNCIYNVQQEQFLNEIEMEKMFSNIDKIYDCNCEFWQSFMLPVLTKARDAGSPVEPVFFKEGFVQHFPVLFQVYFKYFIEHKACLDYAKACQESSELFKIFIMWAESQKQCNRLKLSDILVTPMQRLLKYSLLLQAIQKHTESETERRDLQEMIDSVDKLCHAANNSMHVREAYEKLAAVRKTIEPYDAIEAPNDECSKIIQEYNGNFTLLAPMPGCRDGQPRSLLYQTQLRMKEAQSAKLDVDILLFTDLLLICKSNRKIDRYKIIRPPMGLDSLVVSELRDRGAFLLIYMNEYHVPIAAFTFHADQTAVKVTLEKFRDAQSNFKQRKVEESAELERQRGLAVRVEEEVEYTPLRCPLPSLSFPRSESVDSADRYLPNLMSPSLDTSNLSLPADHTRSSSASDLQGFNPTHRPHLGPTDSHSLPTDALHQHASTTVQENPSERHTPVHSCQSVPLSKIHNHKNGNFMEQNSSQSSAKTQTLLAQASLGQSHDSPPHNTRHIHTQVSLTDQPCAFDEDELSRIKLNSRRTSRAEKRYHTADSIQELKNQEKDSSIHKRLSWRTDVNVDRSLSSKVLSSDSVRSAPSSSGVSSTGSLHLNPESDISEEVEGRLGGVTTFKSSGHPRLFSVGDEEDSNMEDYNGGFVNSDLNTSSRHSKSKSTPDLLETFNNQLHINEMRDGIASVKVATDAGTRQFTHADILKMKRIKHQILFDSEVESSEV